MKYRYRLFFVCVLILCCILLPQKAEAVEDNHFIITYSMTDQSDIADLRKVETMFSAYGDTTEIPIESLTKDDLKKATQIIYLGLQKTEISHEKIQLIENEKLPTLIIGENVTQFKVFKELIIDDFAYTSSVDDNQLEKKIKIIKTNNSVGQVYSEGTQYDEKIPIIMSKNKMTYLALTKITDETQAYIQPQLVELLQLNMANKQKAFVVISGITPQTKATTLQKKVKILKAKKVPFLLSVTPAVIDGDDKTALQFNRSKKIRQEILNLQKEGIAIISNGYSGAYQLTPKGRLAEFWNLEVDSPINALNASDATKIKPAQNFSSTKVYNLYRAGIGKIEKEYTENSIESSVDSLTSNNINPIAFSINNGIASSYVYKEISHHFSTYFGLVSYSDSEKNIMTETTITKPAFMGGMTVYPYNLKVINESDNKIEKFTATLEQLSKIKLAVAGLKAEVTDDNIHFEESLQLINTYPQFTWIDGSKINAEVKTQHISIVQDQNGEKKMKLQNKYIYKMKQELKNNPFEFILWCLFILVLLFVLIFFIHVLRLRITLKKRLFGERKSNG